MVPSTPSRPRGRRTAARTAVVWQVLQQVLQGVGPSRVVDIGGGTGGFAVRVAELGHQVTVIDPSPDALAALARRADEAGMAERINGEQGELASLLDLVEPGSVDVVLCHGVLEIVEDPAAALRTIAGALRPGGALSLLVAQQHAAVVARAMAGHFHQARALLDPEEAAGVGGIRRFAAGEIAGMLDDAGYATTSVHGIRVFADLVPSALLDLETGAAEALVELEQAVADRPEYLTIATQLHILATH